MAAKIYKCFISSPSDTSLERETCDIVFSELNKTLGDIYNFRLESIKWEKDTYPSFGLDAQTVISKQVGNDYDIFIGIMHKKFGTPTLKAGSGTEHEFDEAYSRYEKKDDIRILFYFNEEPPKRLSEINNVELEKVNTFKSKISKLGGLYNCYDGAPAFKERLLQDLSKLFIEKYGKQNQIDKEEEIVKATTETSYLRNLFRQRLDDALSMFSTQPIIWVEPILSPSNEISRNPDDNYNNRYDLEKIISAPESFIIKAPPQFGLTSLSHYLILQAWENGNFWVYLDSTKLKAHTIHNAVKNEAEALGKKPADVKCIILDSWTNFETSSIKKLKSLCDTHPALPIIVMQTIDDSRFLTNEKRDNVEIKRSFNALHLLALPRTQIRKVVSEYNKAKDIGEEDIILNKVVSDLENLNIHRTPQNCLTLLKVSEKHFDESPVNRTRMLEMVLFVLFDMDEIPTYKIRPDLKDCEYVLGRFCESLIRQNSYVFTREHFLSELKQFCIDKLIDLEIEVVFDVLLKNNIIAIRDNNYGFRSSFWIFYFGAKRMHSDKSFCDFIFESKKYIAFPEIIEFYTGIDRNRSDALKILHGDLKEISKVVFNKVGIPDNINPLALARWNPSEDTIEKMQNEIGENVLNSRLPDTVKDQFADRNYNQQKPYDQSIQTIFEEYSLYNLMQEIKATSRALRNSDYVDPNLKKEVLTDILLGWEQISKVLFALAPILAADGRAAFEGASFQLVGNFGDTFEDRVKNIMLVNPTNVVGLFKDDLYSGKMGPLLFDRFLSEQNSLKKHQLALLLAFDRPRQWKKQLEGYIVSLPKNSFFLYDIVSALRAQYRYAFVNEGTLKEIEYLIKMGLAKHHFGDKKPGLEKIMQISNENLPKREYDE